MLLGKHAVPLTRSLGIKHRSTMEREKIKILILSSNPKDTSRLRLDEEVREITEGLLRSKYREKFSIYQAWAVRLRDIRRAMLDYEPHVVHFCGHGSEFGLIVENDNADTVVVRPEALESLFESFKQQVKCVLLNTCYSESQALAISKHIDCVIGMKRGIQDKAAIEFAVGFYDALGAGRTFEEAFKFGQNAIQLLNVSQELEPVLYLRSSVSEIGPEATLALSSRQNLIRDVNPNARFSSYKVCADAPPSPFRVGRAGYVCNNFKVLMRSKPSLRARVIGSIASYTQFKVVEGPECGESRVWWKIQLWYRKGYNGMLGWVPEASPEGEEVYLCLRL